MATLKDAASLALEAGNSPQMIFQHYRELVTEAEGKEWFAIMPPKDQGNVIPMPAAASAAQ